MNTETVTTIKYEHVIKSNHSWSAWLVHFCLTLSVKSSLMKILVPLRFFPFLFGISLLSLNLSSLITTDLDLLACSSNFPLRCRYSTSIDLGLSSNLSASICLTLDSVTCCDSLLCSGTPSMMMLFLFDWLSRCSDLPESWPKRGQSLLLRSSTSFCKNCKLACTSFMILSIHS